MNTPLETQESGPSTRGRRSTSIGVAVGLLAGGAIGLGATMPSLTSAASDADAAVVLQEETSESTETTTETTTETPDDRPEPGERLREILQPLVDDGTIDAGQADAVAAHLVENRPERAGRPGRRGLDGHGPDHAVLAELLGLDREALRTELRAGNSIADIAESNSIDVQTVIDALIDDAESHIALAIEHGMDEETATERLAQVTERIEEGVYRAPGERPADG